jgi:hypothetical protein
MWAWELGDEARALRPALAAVELAVLSHCDRVAAKPKRKTR